MRRPRLSDGVCGVQVRSEVLRLANVSEKEFAMIPMQGSGTFGVEAVISSVIPRGQLL